MIPHREASRGASVSNRVSDVVLFVCLAAFFTGIVLAAVTLLS
jgi:hypothetical protein